MNKFKTKYIPHIEPAAVLGNLYLLFQIMWNTKLGFTDKSLLACCFGLIKLEMKGVYLDDSLEVV